MSSRPGGQGSGGGGGGGRRNHGGGGGGGRRNQGGGGAGRGSQGGPGPGRGYQGQGTEQGQAYRGSSGRGGGQRGGPPARGQSAQMPMRGGRVQAGIYRDGQPVPVPDANITARENASLQETRGKEIDGFPGRRSFGTNGVQTTFWTNYVKVITASENNAGGLRACPLYHYDISVTPEPSKPKLRQFVEQLIQDRKLSGKDWATDYGHLLVTTTPIDLDEQDEAGVNMWAGRITLQATGQGPAQQGPAPAFVQQAQLRNTMRYQVKLVGTYDLEDLITYLQGRRTGSDYTSTEPIIQIMNVIFTKAPNASGNVSKVGKNTFYPGDGHPQFEQGWLERALLARRGYFCSVRPAIGRLLLNLNVASGAFYESGALLPIIRQWGGTDSDKEAFLRMLKVRVEYRKNPENLQEKPFMTKIKTIVGLARTPPFGNANNVQFSYRPSSNAPQQTITVREYFERHHRITLRRPEAPVLNTGTRADPQWVPPELCYILPGQPYRRLLPPEQTSRMIEFAARPPSANAISIAGDGNNDLGKALQMLRLADTNLRAQAVEPFGFKTETSLLTVPGRILAAPAIRYGPAQRQKSAEVSRGSWNLRNVQFRQGGRFASWQAIVINVESRSSTLVEEPTDRKPLRPEALFNSLGNTLTQYGVQMGTRQRTQMITLEPVTRQERNRNNTILNELFKNAKEQYKVKMVFVVLPFHDQWLYARIKFYCDIEYGLHSICAIGDKLQQDRGQPMFFGNLALKFNVKGLGISHFVPDTLTGAVDNNTILFGIDVTHPSPGSSEGAPSIACVVANTDEFLFQWPGSIRVQEGKQEMVQGLAEMVIERLKLWRRGHRDFPTKVVVYRDGVSEGQFKLVLQHEWPAFQAAYTALYGDERKWPKTAIIIVGKRHHTRFYPTRNADAEGKGLNPMPGTVVDRGIVGKVIHEFYMQAHSGLQGTAKPAHYSVIKDDINFTADQLERFTLNLCYHFVRCTKAVSICPPAYYADLLAERGRAYLYSILQENTGSEGSVYDANTAEWSGGVHADLKDTTWYI